MAQTLIRGIAVVVIGATLANTLAQTSPAPQPTPEDNARQAAEVILKLAQAGWPQHAPFKDDVSPDSTNAAARLMWLNAHGPEELLTAAGWVEPGTKLKTPDFDAGAQFTSEAMRSLLIEHKDWIDALDATVRLEKFELYQNCDPRAVALAKGDPRLMLGFLRKAVRVARMDAIHLWESGNHDAALRRLSIAVRLAVQLNKACGSLMDGLVCESLLVHAQQTLSEFAKERPLGQLSADSRADFAAALALLDKADASRVRYAWRRNADSMSDVTHRDIQPDQIGFELELRLSEYRAATSVMDAVVRGALKRKVEDAGKLSDEERRDILRDAIDDAEQATPEALQAALAKVGPLRARIEEAWTLEDADTVLKEIGAEIAEDETGLLQLVFGPSPRHIRRSWAKANDAVRSMEELLTAGNELPRAPSQP